MNRKAFALSWGRKVFFGTGWALLSLIGLTYLHSKIVPQTPSDWLFFGSTFVGHYGLLITILYFVFYYPVIWLIPTYYVSRLWSIFLIVIPALILFADSVLFSKFKLHGNQFIFDLFFSGESDSLKSLPSSSLIMASFAAFVLGMIIWVRGEWLWRSMQGRFSNPVKNWYLLLIIVCLAISHSMYKFGNPNQSRSIKRLAQLFAFYDPTSTKSFDTDYWMTPALPDWEPNKAFSDFYYPKKDQVCKKGENPNILLIVIDQLKFQNINPDEMPSLHHYLKHATVFKNHLSGSANSKGALFSLFYSLPTTYFTAARNNQKEPMLFNELKKRQYEIGIFSSLNIKNNEWDRTVFLNQNAVQSEKIGEQMANITMTDSWKKWMAQHLPEETSKPFFGTLVFSMENTPAINTFPTTEIDGYIRSIIEDLYWKRLLSKTLILITANHAGGNTKEVDLNQLRVPMIAIYPDKEDGATEKMTTHFDVIPTLMNKYWACGDHYREYSYGQSIHSDTKKEWLILGADNKFGVYDIDKGLITNIESSGQYEVRNLNGESVPKSKAKESVVFDVLKDITKFSKR
jgi:membrane-anchored protein YejM (alkaline phosphatase superfamily)